MKKVLFIATSLFVVIAMVNAQDTIVQQNQRPTQLQRRDRIHQEEHLMLLNGKLYKMQYGVRTQVENQVQLRNGGIANPDGSYQLKNSVLMQLHNGECLDLNGNLYQNQNMFGRRQMIGQPKMMQNKNWKNQGNLNQNKRPGKKS
jgi:hypothetical protein